MKAIPLKSHQTNKTFTIQIAWQYNIYLIGCIIYNLPYVSKTKVPFNIRLSNRRKDIKDPKAILADKEFQKNHHRFNGHARSMITATRTNTNLIKEILHKRFIQRENFLISKLQILYPEGLNQEFKIQIQTMITLFFKTNFSEAVAPEKLENEIKFNKNIFDIP